MFQPDEYVVYGRSGVCRVEGIECRGGRTYYSLRSLYQNCHITTPTDGNTPIRPVISKEEANALIDSIPAMHTEPVYGRNTRELSEIYRSAILSQGCRELIGLTMSIYAKKQEAHRQKKRLSGTDEAFFKEGEGLLFGELSVALGIPVCEVPGYIAARVGNAEQDAENS